VTKLLSGTKILLTFPNQTEEVSPLSQI